MSPATNLPSDLATPDPLQALTRDLPLRHSAEGDETPVHLFTDEAPFTDWLDGQTDRVKIWVRANNFTLAGNKSLIVPDATGKPAMVLAAYIGMPSLYASAYLAEQLPAGNYEIASLDGSKPDADIIHDTALAWGLASYSFQALKSQKAEPQAFLTIGSGSRQQALINQIRSVWLTRELVNMPANYMGPDELAKAATDIAAMFGADLTITDDQDVVAREYPAIYAVGKGSDRLPRLIDFTWGNAKAPRVTLVGKGVCFDTGGLDLKPSSAMLNMKKDMGGSAQALGLAYLIMASKLPVRLRVLIPAVENSVSGRAFRPKDIINTRAGITVEVGNTDAEGRLVLADALHVADNDDAELIIDFATLTGAARVALGPDLPAMMTDDPALADGLTVSGMTCGDPIWRLPLWPPYAAGLNTKVADTSSVTTDGFAGSITAGLFLQKFVPNTKAWVHFDVFAWNASNRPGRPEGGEAQAMRAVYHYLNDRYGD